MTATTPPVPPSLAPLSPARPDGQALAELEVHRGAGTGSNYSRVNAAL